MAFPTFVGAGAGASSTLAVTPALPASIATDDILILLAECVEAQTVSIAIDGGGTWTEVTNSPQDPAGVSAGKLTVFWSRYNGIQIAPTTVDPGNHIVAQILAFRGCITTGNPWDVTAGGVEAVLDASGSIPGATTTVPDCLVLAICSSGRDVATAEFSDWTNADLANIVEVADFMAIDGNGGGFGAATGEKATPGTYGATTVTLAGNSHKGMMTIALKPPLSTYIPRYSAHDFGSITI